MTKRRPIIKTPPVVLSVRKDLKKPTILLRWRDEGHSRALSFGKATEVENWLEAISAYRELYHDFEDMYLTEAIHQFTGKTNIFLGNSLDSMEYGSMEA